MPLLVLVFFADATTTKMDAKSKSEHSNICQILIVKFLEDADEGDDDESASTNALSRISPLSTAIDLNRPCAAKFKMAVVRLAVSRIIGSDSFEAVKEDEDEDDDKLFIITEAAARRNKRFIFLEATPTRSNSALVSS